MSYNFCPACNSKEIKIFYEIKDVPVHSVVMIKTKEQAINYPKGNIALAFCNNCGFIFNTAFDIKLVDNMPAEVVYALINKYEEITGITEEEEKKL